MSSRSWVPSKRASELLATLWRAFLDGDRYVRFESLGTAGSTGASLVWNGLAEWHELEPGKSYGRRMRLSNEYLEANGIAGRDWITEARGLLAGALEDGELELAVELERGLARVAA